jgi:quercetin dioxygenase-like cupin family protein
MKLLKSSTAYKIYQLSEDCLKTIIGVLLETQYERTILTRESEKPIVMHKEHKQLTVVAQGIGIVVLNGESNILTRSNMVIFEENTEHAFIAQSEKFDLYHCHFTNKYHLADRYILKA